MSDKFQDRYRICSARAQWWDYGDDAAYFITICTSGRNCDFGKIIDGKMILSELGMIANKFWYEIPFHFPFVELGEFVVMPNHIHSIIVINKINNDAHVETPDPGVSDQLNPPDYLQTDQLNPTDYLQTDQLNPPDYLQTPESGVSTEIPSIRTAAASMKWKPAILGVILNQYKRICTIHARKIDPNFDWQPRFYDHIICSDSEYKRISTYIRDNITKWEEDEFYNK